MKMKGLIQEKTLRSKLYIPFNDNPPFTAFYILDLDLELTNVNTRANPFNE